MLNKKKHAKQKKRLPSQKEDKLHLRRSGRYIPPKHKSLRKIIFTQPLLFAEKQIFEPIAHVLDEWDIFRILEKIIILFAIFGFLNECSGRRDQRIFEAWQTIDNRKSDGSEIVRVAVKRLYEEGSSLSVFNAEKTNLEKIDLKGANLNSANFNHASLPYAELSKAQLQFTKLSYVILIKAKLRDANLHNAYLMGTKLNGADLNGANLESAKLNNADLSGANLNGAILNNADLKYTRFWDESRQNETENITPKQIKQAKNWQKAIYSPEFSNRLGLKSEK